MGESEIRSIEEVPLQEPLPSLWTDGFHTIFIIFTFFARILFMFYMQLKDLP